LTLALFPARKKTIAADLLHLTVLHPNPADEDEIAAFVGRWLKEQALALLAPRVLHFARQVTGVSPAVKLSSARTQWGRAITREKYGCIGAWFSCRPQLPITSSPTRSRILSSSITRRASGRWLNRCFRATRKRAVRSMR